MPLVHSTHSYSHFAHTLCQTPHTTCDTKRPAPEQPPTCGGLPALLSKPGTPLLSYSEPATACHSLNAMVHHHGGQAHAVQSTHACAGAALRCTMGRMPRQQHRCWQVPGLAHRPAPCHSPAARGRQAGRLANRRPHTTVPPGTASATPCTHMGPHHIYPACPAMAPATPRHLQSRHPPHYTPGSPSLAAAAAASSSAMPLLGSIFTRLLPGSRPRSES